MNPEHTTPVKCALCGEPLGINNMYPGCLCENCFWGTSLISNEINELSLKENNLYGLGGFVKEEDDGRTDNI